MIKNGRNLLFLRGIQRVWPSLFLWNIKRFDRGQNRFQPSIRKTRGQKLVFSLPVHARRSRVENFLTENPGTNFSFNGPCSCGQEQIRQRDETAA